MIIRDDVMRVAIESGLLEIIDDAYQERADWGDYVERFFRAAYEAGAMSECAALREDAERYRHLCEWQEWTDEIRAAFDCSHKFLIDEAIDNSRKAMTRDEIRAAFDCSHKFLIDEAIDNSRKAMTRDEIIELVQEAGISRSSNPDLWDVWEVSDTELESVVRAAYEAGAMSECDALRAVVKDAFFEGFTSVATYNDSLLTSPEEAWAKYETTLSRAALKEVKNG